MKFYRISIDNFPNFFFCFFQSHNQFKENLNENCVTYFCPGHLNRFNDRKVDFSSKAITYLTFSPNGQELLVNMGAELIYLYDINHAKRPVVSL